jgi:hypothetical protein
MSSPLDGRIRKLAREEADAVVGISLCRLQELLGNGDVDELRKELTAVRERVDALEKTPSAGEQAKTVSRRGTARKESTE